MLSRTSCVRVWFCFGFFPPYSPIENSDNKLVYFFCCCSASQSGCSFWIAQVFMAGLRSSVLGVHHITASSFLGHFALQACFSSFPSLQLGCLGSWMNTPWQEHFHTLWENGEMLQVLCSLSTNSVTAVLVKLLDDRVLAAIGDGGAISCLWKKPSSPAVISGWRITGSVRPPAWWS